LLDENIVNNICDSNDGYKFLRTDRSSPSFWEEKKRELLATIRQIGIPSIFLTLSAAETKWIELLIILAKIVDNREITDEEAINMEYEEKVRLISSYPVTCARYFDHRIRELFKLLKHINGPFGEYEIIDSYCRIEFQFRGSPHVHCVLWLKNCPKYIKDDIRSHDECVAFINSLISTESSNVDEELLSLLPLQHHKHSKTCKKFRRGQTECRFGIPHFPMPETRILEPVLDSEFTDDAFDYLLALNEKIKNLLHDVYNNNKLNLMFDSFLQILEIDYQTYLNAIRVGLKQPKVLLKRDLKSIRLNAYNPDIMRLHRANMDIQYILNGYAISRYILDYINKSQRGMSLLLREAQYEVKKGNCTIRERLRSIGNKFLNASEISAQEAVYHILGMPLSISSRKHIFINTGEPRERTKIAKS